MTRNEGKTDIETGRKPKKRFPVWGWILIGIILFPILLIILLVGVLLVVGFLAGVGDGDSKEEIKSASVTVQDEYVYEALDEIEVDAIAEICGLEATVQEDWDEGYVDTIEGENPYDVVWDYGSAYNTYVNACNWSLVFDVDYYMDTFPMLAMQYHYDEELLLQHFQTVGIHEGRQGSADFNVFAYLTNGSDEAWETFEYDFEGYYFYYMLNYETEKNTNTIENADGTTPKVQHKEIYTAAQLAELNAVNEYRAEIGEAPLTLDSEMCAMANHRAYINAHDNYNAHDWMRANLDEIESWCASIGTTVFSENTVTLHVRKLSGRINASDYANSEDHYEAMTNGRFNYTGISNTYVGDDSTSQFDVFTDDIETAMH